MQKGGGEIHFGIKIDRIHLNGGSIASIEGVNEAGERVTFAGDYFFSTMPVRDLIRAISATRPAEVPAEVIEVAEGLMYRDFITVGLLASRLAVKEKDGSPLKDNWIYIQEPDVTVGRLQVFNNWSPYLVGAADKVWIGLEYFCNDTDDLWKLPDEEMAGSRLQKSPRSASSTLTTLRTSMSFMYPRPILPISAATTASMSSATISTAFRIFSW